MLTPEQNDAIFGPSIRVFRLTYRSFEEGCGQGDLRDGLVSLKSAKQHAGTTL
jgi:hypothetical protein